MDYKKLAKQIATFQTKENIDAPDLIIKTVATQADVQKRGIMTHVDDNNLKFAWAVKQRPNNSINKNLLIRLQDFSPLDLLLDKDGNKYKGQAQVLADLGTRLVDDFDKSIADHFISNFDKFQQETGITDEQYEQYYQTGVDNVVSEIRDKKSLAHIENNNNATELVQSMIKSDSAIPEILNRTEESAKSFLGKPRAQHDLKGYYEKIPGIFNNMPKNLDVPFLKLSDTLIQSTINSIC